MDDKVSLLSNPEASVGLGMEMAQDLVGNLRHPRIETLDVSRRQSGRRGAFLFRCHGGQFLVARESFSTVAPLAGAGWDAALQVSASRRGGASAVKALENVRKIIILVGTSLVLVRASRTLQFDYRWPRLTQAGAFILLQPSPRAGFLFRQRAAVVRGAAAGQRFGRVRQPLGCSSCRRKAGHKGLRHRAACRGCDRSRLA